MLRGTNGVSDDKNGFIDDIYGWRITFRLNRPELVKP